MSMPTLKTPQTPIRRLDRERLRELALSSRAWPAYMHAELGVKAPSRIEPAVSGSAPLKKR